LVSLTINGNDVKASPDMTILQVCREQNIDNIPTLCYDDKLPPFGSCFLCVVEIEGQKKMFPSCSTKVAEGMKIHTRSDKVVRTRKTCLELLVSDHYADCFGPCRLACPADVDIQGYMSLIHLGKFKEAVALIKEKNPLPSVCGRVCTRKCEVNCRRSQVDSPVGIDFLKRYASDQDMIGEMWQPEKKPNNQVPIAIVGGGPAGLTCAYYLAIEGYKPTIFEANPHMGGMLRYGIPEYRLPKEVLDKEISWITDLGVEVKTNIALGKDFTVDGLFKDGFKAVFVSLGAQIGKPMRVENEDVEGVLSGVEFLKQVEMKTNPDVKGRVVVVGGGNTAIDAARTSLRLGADEVVLLYRRTRNEMPANEMEIVAAEEEGVKMEFLAAPVRVNVENNRAVSIECNRMELGEPDDSGRRRPVKVEGSEHNVEADWIISAIGQEPDLHGVDDDEKIAVTRWKTIEAKEGTFDTDRPGVFAGGDVVTGPADAIDAIAAGRMAARAIEKYIETGITEPLTNRFESRRDNFHKITASDLPDIAHSKRHHMPEMGATERIHTFKEVESGYTDQMAIEESARCAECGCDVGLSCTLQDYCTEYGVDQSRFGGAFNRYKVDTRHPFIKIDSNKCIRCGRCIGVCSDILNVSALGFVNRGFRTIVKPALEKALHETNCVSCGNCIDVCPTGALVEKMPFGRSGPWKMDSVFNVCNYCSVGCNITLKVKSSDLFFVVGAPPDMGPNQGELCARGRFGYQHYLDGSRLTQPMVRKGDKLVKASWDEAFAKIKEGFKHVYEQSGRESVLVSASPKLSNEELYQAGKLARYSIGTNNLASFYKLINGADYHALDAMLGHTRSTVSAEDIEKADLFIVVGGNPCQDNPVLGWQIKRRMRQGTEAIVVNSAKIDMVRYAAAWADTRRGTATHLLNGVMAELIRDGKVNNEFIKDNTMHFEQVKQDLLKIDLEETAAVTGVAPRTIKRIVELLSDPNKRVVVVFNIDSRIDRSSNDLKALATLMLMLGKIGVEGSGLALLSNQSNLTGMALAGFDNLLLPGGASISESGVSETSRVWQSDLNTMLANPDTNFETLMQNDKIRAAIIMGENPAAEPKYDALIEKLDFLVVCDMFKTESLQKADVFLPLSSYLETEGHMTNWAGTQQRSNPIGEPLNGMNNLEIIHKLSRVLGQEIQSYLFADVVGELDLLRKNIGASIGTTFVTEDGKAHFGLYSSDTSPTSAFVPEAVELDARIVDRLRLTEA